MRDLTLAFSSAAAAAGSTLVSSVDDHVIGNVDATRMEQVVGNLIDNAVKFGMGSPIEVELRAHDGTAILSVRDHGPGIPLEEQGELFRRYRRGQRGRRPGRPRARPPRGARDRRGARGQRPRRRPPREGLHVHGEVAAELSLSAPAGDRVAAMPKAIVFGARGTLGVALCETLPKSGYQLVASPSHAECDISDAAAVRGLVDRLRPDVIFNSAAYTDVDRAESETDRAHAINAVGAENVARAAAERGAAVVHYSTDFVFDGEQEQAYAESDPPSPQGAYARTKVEGDNRVAAATPRHFILRVGCLYGHGGRNFPSTIVRRLRAGETIRADRERLGSPRRDLSKRPLMAASATAAIRSISFRIRMQAIAGKAVLQHPFVVHGRGIVIREDGLLLRGVLP